VGHEEVQQPVLGGPQRDLTLAGAHPVARIVKRQSVRHQHIGGARRRRAAHHGLDACQELARRKRLGDVIVGATLEAADLVLLLGSGGEQDDRNLLGLLGSLQRSGQLQAAHVRQHPINQHEIRTGVDDAGAGFPAILRLAHLIARPPQAEGDHVPDRLFVLHHEDALCGHFVC
jgi:hypothetical protein